MTQGTTHIEVWPDGEGGWTVTRDRIVDGCFNEMMAANDYASACARRAQRAGLVVTLRTLRWEPSPSAAA
ncbi:hypothetical protein FQY83_11980 [Luteimonas marina]|uniref:Uncharacterized protein n=1 Tax=Luteimonas marina TaxID=488485 RepID=A0A5C5TXY4_9GAMM|nr:hypothetical protein [Luteimonas marina]TWT19081.1 hypothetical protein FQY83_11980 [Luteimonas marina]